MVKTRSANKISASAAASAGDLEDTRMDAASEEWPYGRPPTLGMSAEELHTLSQSSESNDRSRARCQEPSYMAKRYLHAMKENRHLYWALRRHAPVQVVEEILRDLSEHSTWADRKWSEEETLRKEYLAHLTKIRASDPEWQDEIMAQRIAAMQAEEGEASTGNAQIPADVSS